MKKLAVRNKYVILFLWLGLISASAAWNLYQVEEFKRQLYLETARSFFSLILTTREWNANMGGVYVPVSEKVQPNPYLDVEGRDLLLPNGVTLTKINPAYMTRLIAELALEKNNALFHITSLKPIRPENAADAWESEALLAFEAQGLKEYYQFDGQARIFNYMAPLVTQKSCLACHARQGYQEGDIRGGISITMKTQPASTWALMVSHLLIALAGAVIILIAYSRLNTAIKMLEDLSNRDGLTQIFNRSYFDSYYQREYMRCRRTKMPLSILLCDVDLFKAYNDTYGHPAGDAVLKRIAAALSDMLKRPGDLAARYGGEEFVVLLPETPLDGALVVAEMLRVSVEELNIPHTGNITSAQVTISIGCWTYQGEDIRLEEALEKADKALYQAKHLGRNIVCGVK